MIGCAAFAPTLFLARQAKNPVLLVAVFTLLDD
jgi:hypothetical protein